MKISAISACYVSPAISVEQFIPEHFFLYLAKGSMMVYDGNKEYTIKAGDYGIARRNHLAKYSKIPDNGMFEKVVLFFDQEFLKEFSKQHLPAIEKSRSADAVIKLGKSKLVINFLQSLTPYFNEEGKIDERFLNVKRTELLLILLKENPEIANIFFDFSSPGKIDLEKFMNRNYKFNVSIGRFAYLTGRSLSAFKRDFEKIFNATPAHWLVQKRLEEAHFLIGKKNKKPSDIYLDLGFEDLSHFSFAFKKLFGHAPTGLNAQQKNK
ncbi:MAG: Helix-turn-helix, AraC domain protein [Bacteroidetes bacterium]|nr:Helix-turn-helix, AraC domain protein [Bacteroidota bacterium]